MKNLKYRSFKILLFISLVSASCKKQDLDVTNLNNPSYSVLATESGVLSFASGFYKIGFGDQPISSLNDGLGYGFHIIVQGFHESMGDNIYVPWGNNSFRYANSPLSVTLDNGTVVNNPQGTGLGQKVELRQRNNRAFGASNSFLPEWTYMYFLNNSANVLLSKIDGTTFSGDADTKKKVLKAWAYWWKGYAYSRIGSMYYAGLKIDVANSTNGSYLSQAAIITEAGANLDKAANILGPLTAGGAFDATIKQIIPTYMQYNPDGSAGIPTPASWIKNINSLKARNLLVNTKLSAMSAANWTELTTLVNAGVSSASDYVFLMKNYSNNALSFTLNYAYDGSVQGYTAEPGNTYFISERLIQDFRPTDKRFINNFDLLATPEVNKRGRSISFGTRYYLKDAALYASNGAISYYNSNTGVDNFYLGVSFEENQLMKAEALINTGQVDAGVALINAVRSLQNANITSPNGLSLVDAKEELRKERRCALLFRGLAFYDARRLGYIDDVSVGGGRKKCTVLSATGAVNTNATINYNYLSYWDVPQNELDFNAAAPGSAPVRNPG